MADHLTEHVLEARGLTVDGAHSPMLLPTNLAWGTGTVHAVVGDPGHGHTALALALAGRLVPTEGTVVLDGDPDPRELQRKVALVDVPGVSEPDGVVPLGAVIGEELALARMGARRAAVAAWAGTTPTNTRTEDLPAAVRVSLFLRLAALRPGIRFLVLTMPERYGALPVDWEPVAAELAAQGYGVLVTTGLATAAHVTVPMSPIGPPDSITLGSHVSTDAS